MTWNPKNTPNFTEDEMACKCGCGASDMDGSFMKRLQEMRDRIGPLTVTSGFRCAAYNEQISGGPEHPLGKAADIQISGHDARRFLTYAVQHFPRIGVSQSGNHENRFIHVGSAGPGEVGRYSPWLWSY